MKKYWFMFMGFLLLLCIAETGFAGVDITLYKSFAGNINFTSTGGALRTSDIDTCDVNISDSASLSGIPTDATVIAAYLYWAGSYSTQTGSTQTTPDYDITFESQNISAEREFTEVFSYTPDLDFFSGFADVTSIVSAKGNGTYSISGLNVNDDYPHCNVSAVLSGWALIVIYEDTGEDLRVINHYDGFQYYYGSEIALTPSNFQIPSSPINGKYGYVCWEGDEGNSGDLNGFSEGLTFDGNTLTDTLNPINNQFNSTINILSSDTSYGVDIDVYDIDTYLAAGQTSASATYSSGADLVFLSAETISVTNIPVADIAIDKAHSGNFEVGEQGTYTLTVTNNGPNDVAGTDTIIVEDILPSGLTYASSSGTGWTVDTSADPTIVWSHAGPLVDGDSLPAITLNVTVGSGAFPEVTNTAAFSTAMSLSTFDNISENNQDDDVTGVGSDLTTSIMTVLDLNGGDAEPGDELRYTLTLIESGGVDAVDVDVLDHIPANVEGFTIVSIPSGATDNSSYSPAGNNGNGLLDIQDISISANHSVDIVFKVTISAGTTEGTQIDNNADISITNPYGLGATVQAATVTVSESSTAGSGSKQLYLYSSLDLSRTPPAPTQADVTIDGGGSSETWTMTPVCQSDLTVNTGTAEVTLWLSRNTAWNDNGNRTVIVELETSSSQSIGSSDAITLNLGTTAQEYMFDVTVSSDVQLTTGVSIVLVISNTTNRANRRINVTPIGNTSTSRVELEVSPVINVDSVTFFDDAYPNGSAITDILLGNTFYVRASISDPFGTDDITDATIEIVDSELNTVVSGASMSMVYDSGSAEKTFEYSLAVGSTDPTGIWTATVTAVEGTEGTVTDQGIGTIRVVDTSVVEFTDAAGDPVDGYDMTGGSGTACVQVEDAGQNQNSSLVETATVTVSDATTGDDETLVLTETGPDTGIFFNCLSLSTASGTDNDATLNVVGGYDITVSYVDSTSNTVTDTVYIPTRAVLSSFSAYEENGRIIVAWETVSEVGTLGFLLYRKELPAGKYIKLTRQLLPGLLVSEQGGIYQFADDTALPGKQYQYRLVELETKGRKMVHGPFDVFVDDSGADVTMHGRSLMQMSGKRMSGRSDSDSSMPAHKAFMRKAREVSGKKISRSNASHAARKAAMALRMRDRWDFAKIQVTDQGFHYLDADEISQILGIRQSRARMLISRNRIKINNMGEDIPYARLGDQTIYFLGEPIDSVYTDKNVYFLEKGAGKQMAVDNTRIVKSENSQDTFIHTIHMEEDNYAAVDQCDDPEEDYWMWDYIFSGIQELDKKNYFFNAPGVADSSFQALLKLNLMGANNSSVDPDHHILARLNNTQIGEGMWDGTDRVTIECSFDQSLLNQENNVLEITGYLDTGADLSVVYIDSFDLQYERNLSADDNTLVFPIKEKGEYITVTGFTSEHIVVADITDPKNPILIKNPVITDENNTFSVSFRSLSSNAEYLATAEEAFITPVSFSGGKYSRLKNRFNSADYLVITPFELREAAQALADYRESQGLVTMVVELSEIMDTFNFGVFNPTVIAEFLSYAYHNYRISPEFVVLIGDGTYDYKNRNGFEDNLMPPVMVNTPDGLFASDNYLSDVLFSDGVPDLAIGRLPVVTPEELYTVIDKIKAYEQAGSGLWTDQVLLLADNPDSGGDFSADSNDVADLIPSSFTKRFIYLNEYLLEDARQLVLDSINQGALLLNFMGHGGLDRFTDEGLLVTEDVTDLKNEEKLPVVAAMTCITGHFAMPGYDALSEALVLHDKGGAIAVWAPTGLSINSQAKLLDQAFFKALFEGDERVLGKAVIKALEKFKEEGNASYMLDIYTLLGDPALRMW